MAEYSGEIEFPSADSQNHGWAEQYLQSIRKRATAVHPVGSQEAERLQKVIGIIERKLKKKLDVPIEIRSFEFDGYIGFGSFGKVWKAYHPELGDVALKQLPAKLEQAESIWKERDMLILLKHHRICNLLASFYDTDVFFAMELCHGSVDSLLLKINRKNVIRFALQLLDGIAWIHNNDIVHADLKPDNCLINTSNNLVISDFGSAVLLKGKQFVQGNEFVGSLGYLDYEATKNFKYSKGTDIFSAACILFEMDTRSYLLKYSEGDDYTCQDYINAFEKGRIVRPSLPGELEVREPLAERVEHSVFEKLLCKMILNDETQISADDATRSPLLFELMNEQRLRIYDIDKDPVKIFADFNKYYEDFQLLSKSTSIENELAFPCVYYVDYENVGAIKSKSARPNHRYL